MAFVVDTNFVLTLRDINQLNALSRLKRDVMVTRSVKGELRNVDLEPFIKSKKIQVVDVAEEELSALIEALAKKLDGNVICFVVELQGLINKVVIPEKWKIIDDLIVKGVLGSVFALNKVITNDLSMTNVLEKTDNTKILGHTDLHVCVVFSRKTDNYIMTMDAGIWAALYILNPNSKDKIMPIFSCLRVLFRDEPIVFIDSLSKIIATKRYKFARDIVDSSASRICYDDLDKSIDDVLTRYLMQLSEETHWESRDLFLKLIQLRGKVRDMVRTCTTINGNLEFDDSAFIKELSQVRESLNIVQAQSKQKRN